MKKIIILVFISGMFTILAAESVKITPGFYTYIQTIMGNVSLYVELKPNGKCDVYSASTEEILNSTDKIPYKKGTCSYNVKKNILTFKTHESPKTQTCSFFFVDEGSNEKTGESSRIECSGWRDNLILDKDFKPGVKNN